MGYDFFPIGGEQVLVGYDLRGMCIVRIFFVKSSLIIDPDMVDTWNCRMLECTLKTSATSFIYLNIT
jgi:hypothetical protein